MCEKFVICVVSCYTKKKLKLTGGRYKLNLINNAILNSFSIILLIIIAFYSINRIEEKTLLHKLYVGILITTMFLLILDILGRTDGNVGTICPLLNHVSNFLLFLLNPILPSIWLIYVHFKIYHSIEKTQKLIFPLMVLNVINAGFLVATQFNGWYYYIDVNNIYHRGPLFILSTVFTFLLMLVAFIMILHNRREINRKQLFSLLFFPFPPLIGTILQICFYGIAFVLNATVLSLLIILLSIKDDTIYTDYLTGLCNRKKVEEVLKESIRRSSQNRTFSLIMLDIDKFKETNDTFGHEMGDNALRAAAELLNKCMRSKDYVARYGGDEFCLILEIYDYKNLEATVRRINHWVDLQNASSEFPFCLSFSMGYAVYDYASKLTAEEFIKQVDLLMYENKRMRNESIN